MKIKTLSLEIKNIALKTPFVTALRRVESIEFVRVTLVCDDWSFGIGEAPATFAITGEDIETIFSSILELKEELIGLSIDDATKLLQESSIGSSAKAALDIALVTLRAKEQEKSLLEYFKVENLEPIETDITISLNDEDTMLQDAKKAQSESINYLKIKLGSDISHGVRVTKRVAKELSGAKLLIDANQAWSREDALLYLKSVENVDIELVEQPLLADDISGLKILTNATKIPILADEAAFVLEDVKAIVESKSANMINIKLMKCGGVSSAIEILEYAREKKIPCMLGSMLEGPYSINAALYLAFAYRDVIEYVDLDSPLLYAQSSSELDFFYDGATIHFKAELIDSIVL